MTTDKRPLILVSNDDGINALGVHELISRLVNFGDVIAVCPDAPRSGQSMAITVNAPLRLHRHPDYLGARMWSANGTPVDCIKLALYSVCRDHRPDIVVSGINHGSNASVNALYSGTMGAAFEACAESIPAVGFSLTDHAPDADFKPCFPFVDKIVAAMLDNPLPKGVCLNVNIPNSSPAPTEMKIVRSCKAHWSDEYVKYLDPAGHEFFWLSGSFVSDEPENPDTDQWCLSHGITSVVFQTVDRTDASIDPQFLSKFHDLLSI